MPYSQTGTHDGYRTDCSGFASMCWKLAKPGPSTGEFLGAKVCYKTSKEHLEPGDFMLAPNHHVTVFLHWTNAQNSSYMCMEEEGSPWGTVKREMTYPYGSQTDFFPCKVTSACSQYPHPPEQDREYFSLETLEPVAPRANLRTQ